jgi:hypothetical protein
MGPDSGGACKAQACFKLIEAEPIKRYSGRNKILDKPSFERIVEKFEAIQAELSYH